MNYSDDSPAIEDSFRKIITVDSIPVMLDIYHSTGNDDYRAYREMYARSSSAFLLMCATEIVDNFLREMISKQFLTLKCPVFYTSGKQDMFLNVI